VGDVCGRVGYEMCCGRPEYVGCIQMVEGGSSMSGTSRGRAAVPSMTCCGMPGSWECWCAVECGDPCEGAVL
jgi:hypothetical protein